MELPREFENTSIHLQMLIAAYDDKVAAKIRELVPLQPELTVTVFVASGPADCVDSLSRKSIEIAFVEQKLLSVTEVFQSCLKFISSDHAWKPRSRAFVLIESESEESIETSPDSETLRSIKNIAMRCDCSFFKTKLINLNQEMVYFILLQAWEHARKASLVTSIVSASNQHAIVATTDKEGNITFANELFCKISEYSIDELLGKNHRILSAHYHSPDFFAELWKTISSGRVWNGAIKNRSKSGKLFWLQTTIVPVVNSLGEITSYVTMRTDVTDLKERSEMSLKQVTDKANFLANVSHEIRSPLQSILGAADLLRQRQDSRSQKELLEIVESSAQSLLALVNDMLDLTKIEVGRVSLEMIPFALQDLVGFIRSLFIQTARTKEIELKISILSERTLFLGDPSRIKQILINLLSNAIKFTQKGSVSLEVVWNEDHTFSQQQSESPKQSHGETAGTLSFIVSDTGMGMSKQVLDSLFQPFVQGNKAIHRQYGGTGLGLSIVKNLVSLMGGKIDVHSAENKGSTFAVSLPVFALLNQQTKALEPRKQAPLEGSWPNSMVAHKNFGSVMLVEDDPLCRKVTKLTLENEGYHLFEFENGMSALQFLRSIATDFEKITDIKAIFLDSGLPDISGLQVAKQIQELGPSFAPIPVIGLSGNSIDGMSLRELGFSQWLTKPVSTRQLLKCLNSLNPH